MNKIELNKENNENSEKSVAFHDSFVSLNNILKNQELLELLSLDPQPVNHQARKNKKLIFSEVDESSLPKLSSRTENTHKTIDMNELSNGNLNNISKAKQTILSEANDSIALNQDFLKNQKSIALDLEDFDEIENFNVNSSECIEKASPLSKLDYDFNINVAAFNMNKKNENAEMQIIEGIALLKSIHSPLLGKVFDYCKNAEFDNIRISQKIDDFLDFELNAMIKNRNHPVIIFSNLWNYFEAAIEIMGWIISIILKLDSKKEENISNAEKLKSNFFEYQKTVSKTLFCEEKKWKLLLRQMKKEWEQKEKENIESEFIKSTFKSKNSLEISKSNKNKNSEKTIKELIEEFLEGIEKNFDRINSCSSSLSSFKNDSMLLSESFVILENLTIISEEYKFNEYLDELNEKEIELNQEKFKECYSTFLVFIEYLQKEIKKNIESEDEFIEFINEQTTIANDLINLIPLKITDISSIKITIINEINSIRLPFEKNYEDNMQILKNSERKFEKMETKLFDIKKNLKTAYASIKLNIFLDLREEEYLTQTKNIKIVLKEIKEYKKVISFLKEYANIELETEQIKETLKKYQSEFGKEEDREETFNKTLVLSGKLHTLGTIYRDFVKLERKNPIVFSLKNNMENLINLTDKYQNFLIKMLNSVNPSELHKIKDYEENTDKIIEEIYKHYSENHLIEKVLSDSLEKLNFYLKEFEKYTFLMDLPYNYMEICNEMKMHCENEIERLRFFEDLKKNGKEILGDNRIRLIILGLKFEKYSENLTDLIKQFENYDQIFKNIPKLSSSVNKHLEKINEIVPCLKIFQKGYDYFFAQFRIIQENFDQTKSDIFKYIEQFTNELNEFLDTVPRELKVFYLQNGDFFIISVKQHLQAVIPENLYHISNETNHLMREVDGRINLFYKSREDHKIMAVSYKRQSNLLLTIEKFVEIINKLPIAPQDSNLAEKTDNMLRLLKEKVNDLIIVCEVAYSFENDLMNDSYKMKSLKPNEKLEILKSVVEKLENKKISLHERMLKLSEENIKSLYVYSIDNVETITKYLTDLIPDIEKYVKFYDYIDYSIQVDLMNPQNLENFKEFIEFNEKIQVNPKAHHNLVFLTKNRINEFVQNYYSEWYSKILEFFRKFDFQHLSFIYNQIVFCNIEKIEEIDKNINDILSDLEDYYSNNRFEMFILQKNVISEDLNSIYADISYLKNSFFLLGKFKVENIKLLGLNKINTSIESILGDFYVESEVLKEANDFLKKLVIETPKNVLNEGLNKLDNFIKNKQREKESTKYADFKKMILKLLEESVKLIIKEEQHEKLNKNLESQ